MTSARNALDVLGNLSAGSLDSSVLPHTTARATYRTVGDLDGKLRLLGRLINRDRLDPGVDKALSEALGAKAGGSWSVPENNPQAELNAIYRYARDRVRYTADVRGVDTFRRPGRTLRLGIGDCDDLSTLIGAMASAAGYQVGLRAVQTKGSDDWNHVYNVVGVPRGEPTKWVPIDGTMDHGVGWEVRDGVERVRTVEVGDNGRITELAEIQRGEWVPWAGALLGLWWLLGRVR